MRFSFFRKSSRHEVELAQIPAVIRKERSREIDAERKKIQEILENTSKEVRKLVSLVENLDKKQTMKEKLVGQRKPGEHLADHYDNYSISVKNKFCARSMEILGELKHDGNDYNSFIDYMEKSGEAVRSIGGISIKEFRHLRAFSEDLKPVAAQIKVLESILENNKRTAKGMEMHKNLHEIEKNISVKEKLENEKTALEKEKNELALKIAECSRSETSQLAEIEEIRKDVNAVEKLSAEKKLLERERLEAKSAISTVLSGLDRLLRKFLHTEKGRSMERIVKTYMMNPADAYIGDDDSSIVGIVNAIQSMEKLTDNEIKRINSIADSAMDLEKHKNEFLLKNSEIERVERLIEEHKEVFRRLNASEDALRETRKNKAEAEKTSGKNDSRAAEIDNEIKSIIEKTTKKAEAMKIEVKIK